MTGKELIDKLSTFPPNDLEMPIKVAGGDLEQVAVDDEYKCIRLRSRALEEPKPEAQESLNEKKAKWPLVDRDGNYELF